MRSQLQIQTSRLNSLQSTGPRTAAGKAISSQNYILKSGIYAESEIIKGENTADLAALSDDYLGRFHPVTPEARALVDILVHSEWILRRLRRAEAQLWDKYIAYIDRKDNPLGRAVDYEESKVFARLQRRIDSTQRNYQRALKDLQQLPTDTPGSQEMEVPAEAPLGFAPSTLPPTPDPPVEPLLVRPVPGSFFPREAPSAWRL